MSLQTFISTNKRLLIEAIVVILILAFGTYELQRANHLKVELATSQQNLAVSQDSLRVTKDKAGKAEYDKLSYVATIKDLKKLNGDLAAEAAKVKGDVTTITKATVVVKGDTGKTQIAVTTPVVDSATGDTVLKTEFAQDTTYSQGNYSKLAGRVEYNTKNKGTIATITKNEIGLDVVTGIKNLDKGKPEIFFKSNYPGLTVTSLSGAVLDPKLFEKPPVRRFGFGVQLGYSPLSYNLDTKTLSGVNQITLGAGVYYRIF